MVKNKLQIFCIVLLVMFAILACVNSVRALCSHYEKIEFTIYNITTRHVNSLTTEHTLTLRAEVDNKLIVPDNEITTHREYHYGDTMMVWYNPATNKVVQHYMSHIITNFISAGLAVVAVALIWPRRKKAVNAKS